MDFRLPENAYYKNSHIALYLGNAIEVLKRLPAEFVQMVMCSPPYYGLRDYKVDGQIGLEATPRQYLENLWAVFDEVKRILKPDGLVFVNMGDTFAGSNQGRGQKKSLKQDFRQF